MATNETQNPTAVIGYDPGFGNTKVCIDGRVGMIQSAVSRPKSVGLAMIGMRAAGQQVPIVEYDSLYGRRWNAYRVDHRR